MKRGSIFKAQQESAMKLAASNRFVSRPAAAVSSASTNPGRAAWRDPIVWALASGPLIVVAAAIATAWIAIAGADPSVMVKAPLSDAATVPAVQARNHSATNAAARKP
jgi:uncharacterized protein